MKQADFPATTRAWYWRVFNLAWPVILSSLSVPLVGVVDTAVMGQLPDPRYMAAVAVERRTLITGAVAVAVVVLPC